MVTCYIGIGSNLGDRRKCIELAAAMLNTLPGVALKRMSSIYETEPVSRIPQGRFLNGVIEVETDLPARSLLTELRAIETALGRERIVKDGPRTIDLDILYYGDETIEEEDLIIPHPKISEREFVLKGLRELGKAAT